MLVLSVVDEECRKIDVDLFIFSGLSGSFHDDLVCCGVDVLEVVLPDLDMEVLCRLFSILRRLILGFLARGDSGEGGGVAGFWMIGEGVSCVVFGGLVTVMVAGVSTSSVCIPDGDVSFSGAVGCRRAGGVDLVVGCCLAAVGWRGHSPAEGAGSPPLPPPPPPPHTHTHHTHTPSCRILVLVDSFERLVQPELSPFRRTFSKVGTEKYSRYNRHGYSFDVNTSKVN